MWVVTKDTQILVKGWPSIGDDIVAIADAFVACQVWVDVDDIQIILVGVALMQELATGGDDLALASERKGSMRPLLDAIAVRGEGKDHIFDAAGAHCFLTIVEDQVGGMTDQVGALKGQGASHLWKDPVEADHDPDVHPTHCLDGEGGISRIKAVLLGAKEVNLAVGVYEALRPDQQSTVEAFVLLALCKSRDQKELALAAQSAQCIDG